VSEEEKPQTHWTLDKRFPIAVVVAIAAQTGGIVYWAGNINSRVTALEENRMMTAPQSDRLTRVEVKLENVKEGIEEIKKLIRREP
jgi:hypothetical protein